MSRTTESHSQVELKIHCRQLITSDFLSRSNAQVYLLIKDQRTQKWATTSCSTEVILSDANPDFVKIVHVNRPTRQDWRQQELIGQFDYDLGSLMGGQQRRIQGRL
ncbi:25104_t:CDS:2, partial [Dentiscutata erythropus]